MQRNAGYLTTLIRANVLSVYKIIHTYSHTRYRGSDYPSQDENAQAALLRVIETKRITRLGSHKEIAVDIRVVAATNCDLGAMVDDGGFRKDLYYRLNTITLNVPPLRERPEEIDALASLFMCNACRDWNARMRSISTEALDLMREYSWPGNVRELRNVIERALVFCTGDRIGRHPGSGVRSPTGIPVSGLFPSFTFSRNMAFHTQTD
ncbi:MAG: sigma-54-dependent Fis family transcriptional regulator [Proteobacteria bacterium]|nr:sigma-54-dependent Fis family transcriptional regulator [Pseudomonadota bacterium]